MMLHIENRERNLLGLRIHSINMPDLLVEINRNIDIANTIIVYGFSANIYSRLRKTPEFVHFFKNMDIIVPDGQGIPLIANLFNVDIAERVGIVNLSNQVLQIANKRGLSVMLFGASEDINKTACTKIMAKYHGIKQCTGINGYFTEQEEGLIVQRIAKTKPDILFIGISSPIKENFALKYKYDLNTKLIIPCGGWIDVVAEKVKRPPFYLNKIPLTWFFRFIQEPRRLFGPIIISMVDTVFFILPKLYLKHLLRIERNPSIIKHLNLEEKLLSNKL